MEIRFWAVVATVAEAVIEKVGCFLRDTLHAQFAGECTSESV